MTFPGAAVWHMPWTDKNDALDWQAYFHHRNRFVAALLHSPYPRGGRMIRESLNHQIEHLVSMQYSTVELRHQALEDVLAGPDGLHAELPAKLGEIREFASSSRRPARGRPRRLSAGTPQEAAAQGQGRLEIPAALPAGQRGPRPSASSSPRELSREFPESEVRAMDAKWYRLGVLDSAVVSMNDGASAAFYQRDPERFRDLMRRTLEIHERLYREWPRLAQDYRDKLAEVTSPERGRRPSRTRLRSDESGQQGAQSEDSRRARAGEAPPPAPGGCCATRPTRCRSSRPTRRRRRRVVDAELVEPAPRGGLLEVFQQPYLLRLIVSRQLAQKYAASLLGLRGPTSSRRCASPSTTS